MRKQRRKAIKVVMLLSIRRLKWIVRAIFR